jgi:mannose-6-phosphate isomerase-like protein (cupin superfamily)
MRFTLADQLAKLPGPKNEQWPDGYAATEAYKHGTMRLLVFAPRGSDRQKPHTQDEIYIVAQGRARFVVDGKEMPAEPGDALFVPANAEHRFHDMSDDFAVWVVFYGREGGEAVRS